MFKFLTAGILAKTLSSFAKTKEGKNLGLTDDIIQGISKYIETNNDFEKEILKQAELARQHDLKSSEKNSQYINNIRGAIRPFCTLIAFAWYLYAKLNNIELNGQDYAMVGGILAFWFGFRSLDKKSKF